MNPRWPILRQLREQKLQAGFRSKLEAVIALWEGRDRREIEHCAKASLRTVQRWAASIRRFGSDALEGRERARRLAALYGMSPRQTELLMLLRRNSTNAEVANGLQARPAALKSLARELRLKLDLSDQGSLREFARGISAYSMSAAPHW